MPTKYSSDELASLKASFDRDGFVILRGYCDQDEVAEMRRHLGVVHEHADSNQVSFGSMKSLDALEPWFHNYLLGGDHITLIKHLIDDGLSPDNVSWISKPQGVDRTYPHFDALGAYRSPPSGASLWIALDAMDAQNGCLHYERGSHRKVFTEAYPLPDYDETNERIVQVEVMPGDAVIHSARVVHFSIDPLDYSRPRNAMVYVYWGASSRLDPVRSARSKSQTELQSIVL
ncbi:MAG: phytanoyl-CoA dioxygenase family protein [Pseudomonadota bacterium]